MAGTLNDIYANQVEENVVALTTNATAQVIKEYGISPFEGGFFEVYCTGADKSGNFVNGIKYCRFKKDSTGVLTLTSPQTILPTQADTAINAANFNIITQNQNIAIQVTGVAGVNIGWNIFVFRVSVSMNNF